LKFQIAEIDKKAAYKLLVEFHYSPTMPRLTKHYLGCYANGSLVGVVTLGWGTRPKCTINKMFPGSETTDYFEIGKMAMLDSMPRNSESQMLKAVVHWMKTNLPDCKYLYTLADGIVGKVGYVYQASNFYYGGTFWTDIYMGSDGAKIHPRSAKELLVENAEFAGKEKVFWLTPAFMQHKNMRRIKGLMFRYIYPLTKKARRDLFSEKTTMEWTLTHPKHDALMWKDATAGGRAITLPEQPVFDLEALGTEARRKNVEAYR
jgi:hypothetical protein